MEFVDYYSVLHIGRKVMPKQIRQAFLDALERNPTPDEFALYTEAYSVLRNRYKRARYDRSLGYFMSIQTQKMDFPNAITYRLSSPKPSFGLQNLIQRFKEWIQQKYDLSWDEALLARYGYQLRTAGEYPYLMLRFPNETQLEKFAQHLLGERVIKMFT